MRTCFRSAVTPVYCLFLSALGLVGAASAPLFAEAPKPGGNDRRVTLMVSTLLQREHVSKRELNNQISQRGFNNYLKALDPSKMYFLKSDVEEFKKQENSLDDMLKDGDITFAYTVFQKFLDRVADRVKLVDQLLKEERDFTANEEVVTDADKIDYAADDKEVHERWRKRIKLDLLGLKADKKKVKMDPIERLTRRYHGFARRMNQIDSDDILEMFLTSITTGYDPHTTYMSRSTLENFYIQMRLNLDGIGAALQMDDDGVVLVSKVIPDGPCAKLGKIKDNDRIVSVGQAEGEMVEVSDMRLNDVVQMIRGKAGTSVRLGVIHEGTEKTEIYAIKRDKVPLKDSEARGVIFEAGMGADGKPFKVGVIDLPSFYMDMAGANAGVADYKSSTRDVKRILDEFNTKGVDAVVLDLRKNGGGSLPEAIHLSGLFIDRGVVVQVKDADGNIQPYNDTDRGATYDGPLVILTSRLSASASEILAGAIQDYGRGIIVGDDTTHGKGTVQSLLDLGSQLIRTPNPPNLGALKITMQQFYRPGGDSTQKRGVLSDITLPSLFNHMDGAESDLDFALEFDKVDKGAYNKMALAAREIISQLRTASTQRMAGSEDFKKLNHRIERYKAQKEKKSVSLVEAEYLKQRAELDAEKDDEKDEKKNPNEVVKRDFYLNEVLAITVDYLETLRKQNLVARPMVKPAG